MNNSMLLGKYLQTMITYKYFYIAITLIASFFSFSFAITLPEHEYLTESIKTISLKKLGTAKHVNFKNKIIQKNLVLLFIRHENFKSQKIISEIQNIRASIQNSKIEYFLISDYDNDSALLSMVQKYPNKEKVCSPGTVVISASGEIDDVKKIIEDHNGKIRIEKNKQMAGTTSLIIFENFNV